MDWNLFLNYLLKSLGSALVSLLITYATILFSKWSVKLKESRITNYIKQVVKAAEQLFPNEGKKMGKEKYEYVLNQVLLKFPKLTENEYLKSLIEGCVFELSQQIKQISEKTNEANSSKIDIVSF